MGILLGISMVLFGLFALVYKMNKTSIFSGFLFSCFLLSAGATYAVFALHSKIQLLEWSLILLGFAVVFVFLFGIYVLVVFLLLNFRAMFKKERRSLANSLTLIAALGIVAVLVFSALLQSLAAPLWLLSLAAGFGFLLSAYVLHIWLFLTSLLLCNLARPALRQDYIVVLGSGLVNGEVTPLLGRRIDKAIHFYQKQKQKGLHAPPKLVMSGGQGADEPCSEAAAMSEYARRKGVPEADILLEGRSTSTLENMRFSKKLIERESGGRPVRCIYATSNYHLLRAGVYARRAGLPMDGLGARTALYYLPTALLREYIAFLWLYKKAVLILAGLVFLLGMVLGGLQAGL